MKNLKSASGILCCGIVILLSSCSNDCDVTTITPEEKMAAFEEVKGNYSGDLIYLSENKNNREDITDTLNVRWVINTDSTMTIMNFPTKLLAENITDLNIGKALAAVENMDIKCNIEFTSANPVRFLINPSVTSYQVNYGDAIHKIYVTFLTNHIYSYGAYNSTSKKIQMEIVEKGIYVDEKLYTGLLKTGVPFIFKATR